MVTEAALLSSVTPTTPIMALVTRRGIDLVECGPSTTDLLDDLVRCLGPDEGLGVLVPVLCPQPMAAVSSLTLPNTPRRSRLSVSRANQRSTRLSQDELVGVKCRCQRACGGSANQRRTSGAIWAERLSKTTWTS